MAHFCRGNNTYSTKELFRLVQHNQVYRLPIGQLSPILDVWIWAEGTPKEIMSGKIFDASGHRERVERKDVKAPIIISKFVLADSSDFYDEIRDQNGHYDVLFGVHALCKHVAMGAKEVSVVIASREQIEKARIRK